MEGYHRKNDGCPQLLDLISKEMEWGVKMEAETSCVSSDEKKLELRLAPPGGYWTSKDRSKSKLREGDDQPFLSFTSGTKRGFTETVNNDGNKNQAQKFSVSEDNVFSTPWPSSSFQGAKSQQQAKASFLQLQSTSKCQPSVVSKESSHHCCTTAVYLQSVEEKAFSPPASASNTAVPNSSSAQKRAVAAPSVVGWPPICSFRKNIASSSPLKPTTESKNVVSNKVADKKPVENCPKGLFVKINMDGVPIGRKVDLNAYNSYEKLSAVVDDLFRDLLAGSSQGEPSAGGIKNKGGDKAITSLLDRNGEYTLVYEDHEGDRMLVGDVPWHMFLSNVKRLRVLKSSEVSTLSRGCNQGKLSN